MTLTEFLLARIAEDEAAANLAVDTATAPNVYFHWRRVQCNDVREWMDDWPTDYTPARVLAECEAKRRIIGRQVDPEDEVLLHDDPYVRCMNAVLRDLALPYADHPDFDRSWAL